MVLLWYIGQILYLLGPVAVKLSLLLLYRRVFASKNFGIATYALGAFIVTYSVIFLFLSIFYCSQPSTFWNDPASTRFFDLWDYTLSYSVVNITTDFIIWALPLPMVWRLHLPRGQKIGLSLIFLLGLL